MPKYQFDGTRLRQHRESLPMTRHEVADEVGVSYEYITLIELGYRTPPIEVLASVCRAVGAHVEDLFVATDTVVAS